MPTLNVVKTSKVYKHFQFYGMADGAFVGAVSLNGAPMHELEGQPGSIATSEAQSAAKRGENVIRVEFKKGAGAIEYALLGAATDDETTFTADHIVDLTDDVPAGGPFPWIKEYRFVLDGPAYAVLKK